MVVLSPKINEKGTQELILVKLLGNLLPMGCNRRENNLFLSVTER